MIMTSTTDWETYLLNLDKIVSPAYAAVIRTFWSRLVEAVPNLPPPQAGPGGELGFCLAWDTPTLHVDMDLAEDGTWEWFYSRRDRDEYGGSDGPADAEEALLIDWLKEVGSQ